MCYSVSEVDPSDIVATGTSSIFPATQYSQMYSSALDATSSSPGSYLARMPYLQQVVQHVAPDAGAAATATAVFQPPAAPEPLAFRPDGAAASTLVLQHETSPTPTHFVLRNPTPPSIRPPPQQILVGQPAAMRPLDVEGFGVRPPVPAAQPHGSLPYPAVPCVSGVNTATGPLSYWMTLN